MCLMCTGESFKVFISLGICCLLNILPLNNLCCNYIDVDLLLIIKSIMTRLYCMVKDTPNGNGNIKAHAHYLLNITVQISILHGIFFLCKENN